MTKRLFSLLFYEDVCRIGASLLLTLVSVEEGEKGDLGTACLGS